MISIRGWGGPGLEKFCVGRAQILEGACGAGGRTGQVPVGLCLIQKGGKLSGYGDARRTEEIRWLQLEKVVVLKKRSLEWWGRFCW